VSRSPLDTTAQEVRFWETTTGCGRVGSGSSIRGAAIDCTESREYSDTLTPTCFRFVCSRRAEGDLSAHSFSRLAVTVFGAPAAACGLVVRRRWHNDANAAGILVFRTRRSIPLWTRQSRRWAAKTTGAEYRQLNKRAARQLELPSLSAIRLFASVAGPASHRSMLAILEPRLRKILRFSRIEVAATNTGLLALTNATLTMSVMRYR
jgi:hypothetical protein